MDPISDLRKAYDLPFYPEVKHIPHMNEMSCEDYLVFSDLCREWGYTYGIDVFVYPWLETPRWFAREEVPLPDPIKYRILFSEFTKIENRKQAYGRFPFVKHKNNLYIACDKLPSKTQRYEGPEESIFHTENPFLPYVLEGSYPLNEVKKAFRGYYFPVIANKRVFKFFRTGRFPDDREFVQNSFRDFLRHSEP